MIAMAKGAQWTGITPHLKGFDAEADGFECIGKAWANIALETGLEPEIIKENTRTMNPDLIKPTADIIHVDGDHSPEGIERELYLAEMYIKPTGLILVDDIDVEWIRDATVRLGYKLGIQPIFLPTQHGLAVIDMTKRTQYEIQKRDG